MTKHEKRPLSMKKQRQLLYGASEEQYQLANRLLSLMKSKGLDEITFTEDRPQLKDGLICKSLEIDKQSISGVLVHWEPIYRVSTKSDPFCSIYILSTEEIQQLINRVKAV